MPELSYPGVYVQDGGGGPRSIAAVATSIAAFMGWSNRGPVGEAVRIYGWRDYETIYGGLNPGAYLGYAVSQFFLNGGAEAYVVRLVAPNAAVAASAIGGIAFEATDPGAWANGLSLEITDLTATSFSLMVTQTIDGQSVAQEVFHNLTAGPSDPTYAPTVVNAKPALVRIVGPAPFALPTEPIGPVALDAGVSATSGADGDLLVPMSPGGAFEAALTASGRGVQLLDGVPIFNLLAVPGETDAATVAMLQNFCVAKRAFLIVDADKNASVGGAATGLSAFGPSDCAGASLNTPDAKNSAFYFPWVKAPDPLAAGQEGLFPPSGFVAGLYAATDAQRGVWKAPAGTAATLHGATGLQSILTDSQEALLNPKAVNALRQLPHLGVVAFGARTIAGGDADASDWKYVPVRRLALFIEASLDRGLHWAIFEPNAEPLWAQLRLSIGAFLHDLFRQGAFAGSTPQQAYFVKCDAETNSLASVAAGVVNISVGFAPLRPSEFVVIQIQQLSEGAV